MSLPAATPARAPAAAAKKTAKKKPNALDRIVTRLFNTQEWLDAVARKLVGATTTELQSAQASVANLRERAQDFSHALHSLQKTGWKPPSAGWNVGDSLAVKPGRVQKFLRHDAYKAADLLWLKVVSVFGDHVKVALPNGEVFGLYPSWYFQRSPAPKK